MNKRMNIWEAWFPLVSMEWVGIMNEWMNECCWLVCVVDVGCPMGFKDLRCTLCRSMYWFSFQLAIIVDRYYPHFIRYAPSTRITRPRGGTCSSDWCLRESCTPDYLLRIWCILFVFMSYCVSIVVTSLSMSLVSILEGGILSEYSNVQMRSNAILCW